MLERGVVTTAGEVFATVQGAGRGRIRLALGRPETLVDTVSGLEIVADVLSGGPAENRAFM